MRIAAVLVILAVSLSLVPLAVPAAPSLPLAAGEVARNFELVGHDPLHARGMNAAPAMYDHYLYIGSRTDGQPHHLHAGVLVVDVADPAHPAVVGEIGIPDEGLPKSTSRELRVWPDQKLLMVLNFDCSAILHACISPADAAGSVQWDIKFYDLADPAAPALVSTYLPSRVPHEFFLWVDPVHEGRALLYMTTPTSSANATTPNLIVTDISAARDGTFTEIVKWNGNPLFPAEVRSVDDVRLHSLGVSKDGTRAYLAHLGGGFLTLDTSKLADAAEAHPQVSLVTNVADRPHWGNPGAHSAVKIPGRPYVLMTDEVYGDSLDAITGDDHGCPWGWVRLIDIGATASEATPGVVGEYKLAQNSPAYCAGAEGQDPLNTATTSFSAHNPTVLKDLAFVTWHSGGLQAIDISDPTAPTQAGEYVPAPLPYVVTEDPSLSLGRSKVVMWSYPIIKDGLVYVVDLRNGLYVLRYTGPHADEVDAVGFFEGNSNLGDALLMPN